MIQLRFTLLAICSFCLQNNVFAESITNQKIQEQVGHIESTSAIQARIESIDDQAQLQRETARSLDHEIRLQSRYQAQLTNQLIQLQNVINGLDVEMDNIRQTKVSLYPLLEQMTETLTELVLADLPFDRQTRLKRINQLNDNLLDPQLSDAEKLERILIAYQTEIQFGTEVKTWFGRLTADQEVQYLRVGRLGYYYLSLDSSLAGVWRPKQQVWATLSSEQTKQVNQAITALNSGNTYPLLTLPKAQ
ncbi:DUF3450 domain-containing protein [Vibrio fortis]|uniref:DUF3450 domain-containing protein n=1 Tax=Vibrio fortis TaxID=212667 RepID=A0A5N3S9A1_9VIBR|nr:DUF3450 domain-containing protein [Vibrio fortis]KAB0303416.1 DUF3450 domain-containing protein [Vibrio fortis]